ncbi:jg7858 [Pararge aegeria aegeria]|uniref:Jg7858 protein n=1 Tax=Pararge aegeria aegeria TaxID=348720 RepID=A0A8S4QXT9_9NEOP|nr:jg7858 [Pararge aegeria aegeria]
MHPSVVFAMLSSERCWEAVADFCEEVILQKPMCEEVPGAHPRQHRGREGEGGNMPHVSLPWEVAGRYWASYS